MALIVTSTRAEFEEHVLRSRKVVLVDFWAEWCPPCRAMAPILERVAKDMDADVDVVKVDTEASRDNAMLAGEYDVRSIPNMNIFKDGKVVDAIIGMVPQQVLESTLNKHVQ